MSFPLINNDFLVNNWKQLAVETDEEIIFLKNRFHFCYGWNPHLGGAVFDDGSEEYTCVVLLIKNDYLYSVNPQNHQEITKMGSIVLI